MKLLIALIGCTMCCAAVALAADVGPAADVAAVRTAVHAKDPKSGLLGVHVVGNYALTDWYEGEASGYGVYKRASGEHWNRIDWGGGAIDVDLLVKDGIPSATARELCAGWGDSSPC